MRDAGRDNSGDAFGLFLVFLESVGDGAFCRVVAEDDREDKLPDIAGPGALPMMGPRQGARGRGAEHTPVAWGSAQRLSRGRHLHKNGQDSKELGLV